MKKFGIVLLIIGLLIMGYAAVKFIKEKRHSSVQEVQKEPIPFPWVPSAGALSTAIGIILMGAGSKKITEN